MRVLFILIFFSTFLFSKEIVIKHFMGETKINGEVKRVVTLFNGATDTAIALGIKPIGVSESWLEKPTYKYLRKDIGKPKYLGLETQVNIEQIALLKPDLIIATKHRHEKIYKILSLIAPTIITEDINNFKSTLKIMGKALDKEDKALEILNRWDAKVKDLKEKFLSTYTTWPQSISAVNIRPNYIRAYFEKGFTGAILKELGFIIKNSKKYLGKTYIKITSKENIPSLDADIFFVLKNSKKDTIANYYNNLKRNPLWLSLKAVKEKKVYEVDTITWSFSAGITGANLMLDDIQKLLIDE